MTQSRLTQTPLPCPPTLLPAQRHQDLHKQTSRGRPRAGSGCSPPGQSRNQQFPGTPGAELQLRPSCPRPTLRAEPPSPTQGRLPSTRVQQKAARPQLLTLLLSFVPGDASLLHLGSDAQHHGHGQHVRDVYHEALLQDRAAPPSPAQRSGPRPRLPSTHPPPRPAGRQDARDQEPATARPGRATRGGIAHRAGLSYPRRRGPPGAVC